MASRVLLIQDYPERRRLDIATLLPAPWPLSWQEIYWSEAKVDELAAAPANLIIANAQTAAHEAVDLLRRLAGLSHNKRTFAVLPEEIDGGLLKDAAACLDDFALWPSRREEIAERIRRLATMRTDYGEFPGAGLLQELGFAQLVGEDPAFLRVCAKIPLIAESGAPVLITGDTGTGKEFFARAIHHLGKRRSGAFVPVDCAAIPDYVFENELFGHVRGGYTDAHADQKGLAEIADRGTLLLDEVDSLSLAAQAKLLRFLQERTFKPLGASKFVTVDVHVIAATNRDLEACVRDRQFRADLFFRLNGFRLWLPPLRERPLDIPVLAVHFLQNLGPAWNRGRRFTTEAMRKLSAYPWPGNVRELQNIVQQGALLSDGPQILPEHIPLPPLETRPAPAVFSAARGQAIEAFERAYVTELLRNSGGNVTRAAKEAHRNRRSIGRLIKKYNINRTAL
jgi:transcriptional regulator with GAF, ATPase, and Fis domain